MLSTYYIPGPVLNTLQVLTQPPYEVGMSTSLI